MRHSIVGTSNNCVHNQFVVYVQNNVLSVVVFSVMINSET